MFFKLSSEIKSLLIVSLGFMILDPTTNAFKNMQKIIVSSISDDKPGFKAEGYTLRGILNSVFCISIWFAPCLCQAIGAQLTVILSSLGYLYYIGSYAIEMDWAAYSAAAVLGIAYATLIPPRTQYLIDGSESKNVSRNVGIFFCLQQVMQSTCNIFVFFTFEGKKYINQSTRRTVIFGLMGIVALSIISFIFLPKTQRNLSGKAPSLGTSIKKVWNIFITPNMLCMCLVIISSGVQCSFEDGIYSPSIGFTLAFGNSSKGLVALSGISKCVGGLLGYLYSIVLGVWLTNRSCTRKLLIVTGVLSQLLAYAITYMILPDSASFGNTEDNGIMKPNVYMALLGGLLLGIGDATFSAQLYSFIGDNFRESSGEANSLCYFIKNLFVGVNFYWCTHYGLHTQVVILSAAAVLGVVGCILAEKVSKCMLNKKSMKKLSRNYEK